MRIERLYARHLRNLEHIDIRPESSFVLLQGDNAQGKTNILEALYLCATGRSFRHATAGDMLQHGEPGAVVQATVVRQNVRHIIDIQVRPRGRDIRVDDRAVRQATKLLELMNMVAFFPDDLRIIKGSPEERRRFLDRAVANSSPEFAQATLAYHKVLKSRNALLRAPHAPDRALIEAYDSQLVQHGVIMHRCRTVYLERWVPQTREHVKKLLPGASAGFAVLLHDGVSPAVVATEAVAASDTAFETTFFAALHAGYPRDRRRGMTLCGPHRADLLCSLGGQPAKGFASQGQQRALVLALKLAEVECLQARLGTPPVLLLDDVSSELDTERTKRLFEVVQQVQCQVWVTTTGAAPLPVPQGAHRLRVRGGRVTPFDGVGEANQSATVAC
jgi:DNA replication and repair protein RecF